MSFWPFFSPHVVAYDHPFVFGKPLRQWGVYRRHRKHRHEYEVGVILRGAAFGVLCDYSPAPAES